MARRATYFLDIHKAENPRLLVSGGWEFANPGGNVPTNDVLTSLVKAYDYMQYDIGLLSEKEAEVFAGKQYDKTRRTAEEEPFSVIETKKGDKIGFIRFPSLPEGQDVPSQRLIDKITAALQKERSNVDLLVALSDWGWVGEREYLAENRDVVPDILLGSGYGSGVNGRIQADGRCIWVRPYDKGRTICEINIFDLPTRTSPFTWKQSGSIQTQSIGLGDQYSDNPDVGALLQ